MKLLSKLSRLFFCAAIVAGASLATSCGSDEPDPTPVPIPVFDPCNACYKGVMESSFMMGMQDMVFQTQDCQWNVIIDQKSNKASLKLIGAQFAQMMPPLSLLLQNLEYDPRNLTVTGYDIVPEMWEGNGYTPNENYTFREIKIVFNDKGHSGINAAYTVSLKVQGHETEGTGKFNSTGIII